MSKGATTIKCSLYISIVATDFYNKRSSIRTKLTSVDVSIVTVSAFNKKLLTMKSF